jgi:DNA-binding transcriptional LysR family regulator
MALHRLGLLSTRLHYFQAVAQLGSIQRAAQSLNVAPSAISRTIHALEEEELGAR